MLTSPWGSEPGLGWRAIRIALGLLAVFALIVANACFVAAEFSLVSVERWRVVQAAAAGRRSAQAVLKLFERITFYISGTQLGVTIVSLLLGWLSQPLIADLLERVMSPAVSPSAARAFSVAAAFVIATSAQLVLGEQIPKMLAIARSLATVMLFARPLRAYGYLSRPFITVIDRTTNGIVGLLGLKPTPELRSVRSLAELEHVIRTSPKSGEIKPDDVRLLTRSLRFANKTAAEALVPRVEVVSVEPTDCLDELVATSAKSGYSRFPVVEGDLDNVVGVVGVKAVHRVAPGERSKTAVAEIMGEALAVPDSAELGRLLGEMSRRRQTVAVVVDEHGGTLGIITTEDIVEQIVGEIDDEYDPVVRFTQPVAPGVWQFGGDLSGDQLQEECGLRLPEGPYETLAGFALHKMGRIPEEGDTFAWKDWRFKVVEMARLRIVTLQVSVLTTAATRSPSSGESEEGGGR